MLCRSSGPQGKVEPFTVVEDPSAWYAADVKASNDWIYQLTESDIQEIDTALEKATSLDLRREVRLIWDTI